MANFRETLWFKKGLLDALQAEKAAGSGDQLAPAASDLLPLEDRYADDGSVSPEDTAMLSVDPDRTRRAVEIQVPADAGEGVSLIAREMSGGRGTLFAMAGASMLGVVAMLVFYTT